MSGRLSILAARHVGRPLLMSPRSAQELAQRIHAVDEQAFARPGRIEALMRRLAGSRRPQAMDDDGDYIPVPMEERLAYAPMWAGEPEDSGYCWTLNQGVALMQCDTVLLDRGELFCGEVYHGYDTLLAGMREAAADQRVRALFLRMCSPGGVVSGGLPALAAFMRGAREAAGGKPIWVYGDMACSAAYWIAAQADRIIAPDVGLIGSIGAVIVHENWSRKLAEEGIEITSIQFGASKTDGAWWKSLSEQAQADLQAEIDQCGRNFVADVALGRPVLGADAALATEARVFLGRHDEAERSALDLKLIDAIASEEEAFAELVAHVAQPGAMSGATPGATSATAPTLSPAATAAPAAAKETPVKRSTLLAALTAAGVKAETLNLVQAEIPEDQPEAGSEPDTDPEMPDDEEGTADAVDPKTAEAILDLPEAKGRDALARKLAFSPGMTVATAKGLLDAAPRGGGLASAMAGSRRLGADGPAPKAGADRIDVKAIYDRRAQRAGRKA